MTATYSGRAAASRLSMNSTIAPTAEPEWGSCRSRPLLARWRAEDSGLAVTAPFPGRNQADRNVIRPWATGSCARQQRTRLRASCAMCCV